MDLTPYVECSASSCWPREAGGEDAPRIAGRLIAPLDSAARLVLLDVISVAAGEITAIWRPARSTYVCGDVP